MIFSKPVKAALSEIFKLAGREHKTRIYSYHDDFNDLWCVENRFSLFIRKLITNAIEEIVVVWDDIPSGKTGSVNTSLYLTPIDWVVAFSLAACRMRKKGSNFRITIIDLNSDSSASAPSARFIKQYPYRDIMSMPWVRIVRPISPMVGSEENSKKERDIKDVICALLSAPDANHDFISISRTYLKNPSHDVEVVKSIWRASLIKTHNPDDHHAIANLLGPMLLAGGSLSKVKDSTIEALRNLMKELGLFPISETGKVDEGNQQKLKSLVECLKASKSKILLMDDQWKDGWGQAFCLLLQTGYDESSDQSADNNAFKRISGATSEITIKASSDPEWLLKKLGGDKRFELQLDADDSGGEILFLDLRLFSGKDTQKEADFFEKVINNAKELIDPGPESKKLPWPRISDDDIKHAEAWINTPPDKRTREDSNYITALTLFPRVLSLTDLSLPIVIFSSTGRRDLLEKLKPYGNIITVFEKPRFSADMPDDIGTQVIFKFTEAVNSAFSILKSRKNINDIIEISKKYIPFAPKFSATGKIGYHVEIYIDEEYQQPSIFVGGVCAVFSDCDESLARKKSDAFNDLLIANGSQYVQHFGITAFSDDNRIKRKKTSSEQELRNTITSNTSSPDNIFCFRLENTSTTRINNSDILNKNTLDALYRQALSGVLEVLLFESLPQIIEEKWFRNASISVYPATKLKYIGRRADLASTYFYKYGMESFEPNPGSIFLRSFNSDDVFPVINEILGYRRFKLSFHRAIAKKLAYKSEKNSKYPEQFSCRNCNKIIELISMKQPRNERDKYWRNFDKSMLSKYKIGSVNSIRTDCNTSERIVEIVPMNITNGVALYSQPATNHITSISMWEDNNEFNSVKVGELVKYLIDSAPVIKLIKLLTDEEKSANHILSKLSCGCNNPDLVPDYRSLHYIADEILNHVQEIKDKIGYGSVVQFENGGFDSKLNYEFQGIIRSSRCIDNDDLVGAIINLPISSLGVNYDIGKLLAFRIHSKIGCLSGNDFKKYVNIINY